MRLALSVVRFASDYHQKSDDNLPRLRSIFGMTFCSVGQKIIQTLLKDFYVNRKNIWMLLQNFQDKFFNSRLIFLHKFCLNDLIFDCGFLFQKFFDAHGDSFQKVIEPAAKVKPAASRSVKLKVLVKTVVQVASGLVGLCAAAGVLQSGILCKFVGITHTLFAVRFE